MKKLFVKSIFIPNNEYLKKNIMSLESMVNISDNYDYVFFGWINNKKDHDEVFYYIEQEFNNYKFFIDKINYGKSYYLKKLSKLITGYDYYTIVDHDIIFNDFDFFKNKIYQKIDFNFLVFNQKEDCRHTSVPFFNIINKDNIKYAIIDKISSVGIGCFICDNYFWNILVDLPVNSVYGLEEYFIEMLCQGKNIKSILLIDYYVYHPYDNNLEYKQWKHNICDELIKNITSNIYNNSIESSSNFWNLR